MSNTPNGARHMLLVSHIAKQEAIDATLQVDAMLREAGVVTVMARESLTEFEPYVQGLNVAVLDEDVRPEDIEIAIVLGGDGTILRAAEILRGMCCPIVGVNLGHVGFLAEMERHDLDFTVEKVLSRSYTVEERVTLEVTATLGRQTIAKTWAVNEATVEKQSRMIEVVIGVDGRPLSSFGCDGVVLATPTGSTAYAFSAGGPVVWPSVQAMLLVPIAAHALFSRPLVVGTDSVLTVEISDASVSGADLWCDGRRTYSLPQGSIVEVRRAQEPVRLARIDQGVFTERLVRKFDLPVEGWRGQRRHRE
ncbi:MULTISPECIES: NAD kinase [Leucobacter]|uniref:NAD kinase n=1 Tax=Leucobacter TaxID=55968 RepID=UPI002FDC2D6C